METLAQYFTYNTNPEKIRDTFIELDNQLKLIHERGYCVEVNSTSIICENGIGFSVFHKGLSEAERNKNIENLAKLAVGTYFSIPAGCFSDYTHLPNDHIKNNFEFMENSILKAMPEDNYYREVLVNGNVGYYNDYIRDLRRNNLQGNKNENSRVLSYSTPQGKAMADKEEAAFVNIAFYPIVISLFTILSYMIYILIK